jgi:hypothetical protein
MLPDRYSVSLQGLEASVDPSVYGKQQKSLMKHTVVNSRYAHVNMPRVDPVEIGSRKTGDIRPNSVIFRLLPWSPISFRLAFTSVSIIPAFRGDTNLQVSSLRFRVLSPKPRRVELRESVHETPPGVVKYLIQDTRPESQVLFAKPTFMSCASEKSPLTILWRWRTFEGKIYKAGVKDVKRWGLSEGYPSFNPA